MTGTGRGTGLLALTGAGVRILNGTVRGFGVGIEFGFGTIAEGASISRVSVTQNTADGILIRGAQSVSLVENRIVDNGGAGILFSGTYGPGVGASNNVLRANSVDGNRGPGILIGGFPRRNIIDANRVSGNGGAGVLLGLFADNNRISGNLVVGNGYGAAPGDGIVVGDMGAQNLVAANTVMFNAGSGIHLEGTRASVVQGNRTGGNRAARPPGGAFDLHDSSPDGACDANLWAGNTFDTAFPPCTTGS